MNRVFAPGCAMLIYKPELAEKITAYLNKKDLIKQYDVCCHFKPELPDGTVVINTCAGCDRRYRERYEGISTISIWEIIAHDKDFRFPDYKGTKMSLHDPCPVRSEDRVHDAVRVLLSKMNIDIVESEHSRKNSVCCGDSFYKKISNEKVYELMKKRADQMECETVAVYCVSCIRSMHKGGKIPRYIPDLLFGLETSYTQYDLDIEPYHTELEKFMEESKNKQI